MKKLFVLSVAVVATALTLTSCWNTDKEPVTAPEPETTTVPADTLAQPEPAAPETAAPATDSTTKVN